MTNSLMTPLAVGGRKLANRIVMAPMTRARATNAAMAPTGLHTEYYRQRAGAGLIVSEGLWVSPEAVGAVGVPGIFTTDQAERWRAVTGEVHRAGGLIVAQLGHAGGMSHPDLHEGRSPLAPSAIDPGGEVSTATGRKRTGVPAAMTPADVDRTVEDYRQAARLAVGAGFDGVEIHAHQGYLVQSFLNPRLNRRTDRYGGDLTGRSRFLFQVIDAVTGEADLVGVKMGPYRADGASFRTSDTVEAEYAELLARLNETRVDYLHLMSPREAPRAPFDPDAVMRSLERFGPLFRRTVVANGGFTPALAATAVTSGLADAVSFAGAFIANPDLPARIAHDLPLAATDPATIYVGGPRGYVDYPVASPR